MGGCKRDMVLRDLGSGAHCSKISINGSATTASFHRLKNAMKSFTDGITHHLRVDLEVNHSLQEKNGVPVQVHTPLNQLNEFQLRVPQTAGFVPL